VRERAVQVDRAARIVDHRGVETGRARIERRPRDAIVGREAATVALRAELAQIAGEPVRVVRSASTNAE
jgi:hypothetical protein